MTVSGYRLGVLTEAAANNFQLPASTSVTAHALPFLLEDYAGVATWAGKAIFNHQQVIGQIDGGPQIAAKNGVITYTFLTTPTTVGLYNNPHMWGVGSTETFGYTPLSPEEVAVAREAMAL